MYLLVALHRTVRLGTSSVRSRLPLGSLPHAGLNFEASGFTGPAMEARCTERANCVVTQQKHAIVSPNRLDQATLPHHRVLCPAWGVRRCSRRADNCASMFHPSVMLKF
jgi:hypothetical protein